MHAAMDMSSPHCGGHLDAGLAPRNPNLADAKASPPRESPPRKRFHPLALLSGSNSQTTRLAAGRVKQGPHPLAFAVQIQFTMASPPIVNFITGNANKLREVKAILEPAIEVQSRKIDLEEIQGSIEEVTMAKCLKAAEIVCRPRPACNRITHA